MNKKVRNGLLLIIVGIGLFVGAAFWSKQYTISGLTNKQDCENAANWKKACGETDCCGIWNSGMCRKGKSQGMGCKAEGVIGPLLLLVTGVLMFVVGLGMLVVAGWEKMRK